ncbi:methyltransferase domain-containing protein [Colletotrichum incanum]|nr:methyltransferase domain-containing protein [Colletotrichum incanum]
MTSTEPQTRALAELNRVFWEFVKPIPIVSNIIVHLTNLWTSTNADTFFEQDWLKTFAEQLTRFLRTQGPNLGLRPRDPANPALGPFVDEILGIDIAPAIVDRFNICATQLGYSPAQVHAVAGDLATDGSLAAEAEFDVVIISMALHHLDDPRGMLELLARRVRPGGVLIAVEGANAMETGMGARGKDGHEQFAHEVLKTTNRHVEFSEELFRGWFEGVGCDTKKFVYIENEEISHIPERVVGKPGGLDRKMVIAASVRSG